MVSTYVPATVLPRDLGPAAVFWSNAAHVCELNIFLLTNRHAMRMKEYTRGIFYTIKRDRLVNTVMYHTFSVHVHVCMPVLEKVA